MKVVVVALIVVVALAHGTGADAVFALTREQSERLTQARNECASIVGLGPYEIASIVRAIRPIEKLIGTGQCTLQRLDDRAIYDRVSADIVYQIKLAFEGKILPKTIARLIAICEQAVGDKYCQKAVNIAQLILELGGRNGIL